ncbi:MAG: glycoside hydrolase family 16 protein [Akkermansiaceae bacterium]|nr:glycoside hydrolase family 16 protein [Akkermansiaceae bacterium]
MKTIQLRTTGSLISKKNPFKGRLSEIFTITHTVLYIMELLLFPFIFLTLVASALGASNKNEWQIVWSDEFTGTGHPDPERWGYESGFVRNAEKQFYTTKRLKNARLENGHLIIEGHREFFAASHFSDTPSKKLPKIEYTSASLQTKGLASWKFGKIEVRAKLPKGQGVWPAIWTLGNNIPQVGWPSCGEIDIMEFVGKAPGEIHGNAHFRQNRKHASDHKIRKTKNIWEDFHTYSIEWDAKFIHFSFDGKRYHSFRVAKAETSGGNPFRKPHYLILNLALGGTWGGKIDNSIFPIRYLIDYVRVYQKR